MAILDQWTLDFISNSEEQTLRLGVRLGELLRATDLVCLSGDLGSGKTAVARGIGRGWGSSIRVTSPTYVLANEYPRLHDGRILYHLDCYRLHGAGDIITAGFADILESEGAIMIEWPERIVSWLPEDRLWIDLEYVSDTRRRLHMRATGERSQQLLEDFKQSAFGV